MCLHPADPPHHLLPRLQVVTGQFDARVLNPESPYYVEGEMRAWKAPEGWGSLVAVVLSACCAAETGQEAMDPSRCHVAAVPHLAVLVRPSPTHPLNPSPSHTPLPCLPTALVQAPPPWVSST